MKTAILGGTFNPVHTGHLFLADEIINRTEYDHVVFVPTFQPAHKKISDPIDPGHRLAMLEIAVSPYSCFSIDDCEIKRGGTSYMIDTLDEMHRKHEYAQKPGLIIGDDLADTFHTWKDPDAILRQAEILVVRRRSERQKEYNFPCVLIKNKILPVSSSEIRERMKHHLPVRFLLPEGVYTYICNHELYQ